MAQIRVSNLTFSYEGSADTIFEEVSMNIDTDWKLGLIGRNGKGKTTLLNLFMKRYEYSGKIESGIPFDAFPYTVEISELSLPASTLMEKWKPQVEYWQVLMQMNQIGMDPECLERPFGTLSFGERTRVMLAVLFAAEDEFLLIDEPTNHLDGQARASVRDYLAGKNGFILVSHDRDLLDATTDHVLVLNRKTIEVQAGNFSSWWENKEKQDAFARAENEKHLKEIGKLRAAADRSGRWADRSENRKIGFDPLKETDRSISSRAYIGGKTKKMQARVKNFEKRIGREIEEKQDLLEDIEEVNALKITPLRYHKEILVRAHDLSLRYEEAANPLFDGLQFEIRRGDRVLLQGKNGCGKSSLIAAILEQSKGETAHETGLQVEGTLEVSSGLIISYVNQDTAFLSGTLETFCQKRGLDETRLMTILRYMDFGREQFTRPIESFSEGQKKKVLIAASLMTPAHLYIWDEPLNYIDVFSRMQIEQLIMSYEPAMLLVEHDVRFGEKLATQVISLQ